jgi:RecA-family ATPase
MLVKGVLVERQPMIVGAPPKTLKTSVMCDLAVSLATGTPFLGHFAICRPVKVALFSGESGEWTLAQTLARVCRTRGLDPDATVGKMVVQPDGLPQLSNAAHMDYLRWMLAREGIEPLRDGPTFSERDGRLSSGGGYAGPRPPYPARGRPVARTPGA